MSNPTAPQPEPSRDTAAGEFARLVQIMHRLRASCPWDREQTHESLRPYLIEEAYEVLHALDAQHYEDLCEELGDLMLQVVFHAELAEEADRFCIDDVLRGINEKLIRRHPHVFADATADTPAEVLHRWERIKRSEGKKSSALEGVPDALPALVRAARTMSKMRQAGCDISSADPVASAHSELDAMRSALERGDSQEAARAAGAMLLSVTEAIRPAGIGPEDALRDTLRRTTEAFRAEEARLAADGRTFSDLSQEECRQAVARIRAAAHGEGA